MTFDGCGRGRAHRAYLAAIALVTLGLAFTIAVEGASASKQIVDYFGTESGSGPLGGQFNAPRGIAVNNSGAGPANEGDIYVVDANNNRIQRFGRDDHGTPADGSDDTYFFISAWGAGVDSSAGGSGYQICTVASQCQAGIASDGNGDLGASSVEQIPGIAVDQDTGEVYVSDAGNRRVNAYAGDGAFLRSFGYDVVASGPGQVSGPDEVQQLTVKASGGRFSLSFRGKATGPRGSGHRNAGSTTITSFLATEGTFVAGQGISGEAIQPGTTIVGTEVGAIKISQPATAFTGNETLLFGDNFAHDASAAEIETALNALPSIGGVGGSVTVTGGPGDETGSASYVIQFGGALAGQALPPVIATQEGLTIGSGNASATVSTSTEGGAYEVCSAAEGDVCRAGGGGVGMGQVGEGELVAQGIAVSQPDGNPVTGAVFLADTGNHRVNRYGLDGSSPSSFGSDTFNEERPGSIAVDSRGIVYASNQINNNEIERYDSENANGGGVGFLAPIAAPPLTPSSISFEVSTALAVEPDSDGSGPDTDTLYVLRRTGEGSERSVQQFGPINTPGLTAPPAAVDDEHGTTIRFPDRMDGLALDESTGRLYVTANTAISGQAAEGVYILDNTGPPPTASLDSLSGVTATTVTANATIDPNGPPALSYHLEYSLDGSSWESAPSVVLGSQETPQSVGAVLDPPGGLEPSTLYYVRLVAVRPFTPPIVTSGLTFTTLAAPPIVETTGSPVRSATTARLDSRVTPRGSATTYYFEYGTEGPCDANPCTSTEPHPVGSGREVELVSQRLSGLEPNTTYHYRVVADNGNSGSPVSGEDMTLTTFASDAPLSHGHLPGPPGSDRAWEQVNQPDTGGNPVFGALGFSNSGNRALFRIAGGTPISETGSLFAMFYSERTPAGWQVKQVSPPRSELVGGDWEGTAGTPDLSTIVSANTDYTTGEAAVWRLATGGSAPAQLFKRSATQAYIRDQVGLSADGKRAVVAVEGNVDPAHPAAAVNLYDVSSGTPELVSLLPNDAVGCVGELPLAESSHWVSADGSRVFFPNCAATALYMRNLTASETKLLSGPPLSGKSCNAVFLKSTPGAALFWTQNRLVAQDTNPSTGCPVDNDGDIYRYDLGDGSLKCVTCVAAGVDANVAVLNVGNGSAGSDAIAVADDGSRVYFNAHAQLLPGAHDLGAYSVKVSSGELAYIGRFQVREGGPDGKTLTPDGSVITFASSVPSFNAVGGQQNGATKQFYRYDDRDRSLVCISCPSDGTTPLRAGGRVSVSEDGKTVAFATSTPLSGSDQNTAVAGQEPEVGQDVYEWRDGRLLLVTDGLTNWNGAPPGVAGVSPSGRDIFFLAPTQYTPDALDGYKRLYDARIGGGFEFPRPSPPCPLEVCQGTPKGAPEEQAPGSGSFSGPGNAPQQKRHHKKKNHKKAHKKSHKSSKRHANNNRRTAR